MRELHVVAVSEDGRHVLLGTSRSAKAGTFRVRLDDRLVAAVRGDLRSLDAPVVDLSPKEIQARLRAGESAESIARKAGIAITRVERFGGPVAGEMARTIDAARAARLVRRSGPSVLTMGRAVDAALGDVEGTWTTRREDDGRWRVTVGWFARGRNRSAAWWFDPHTAVLTAVDPASVALAHVSEQSTTRRRTPKAAVSVSPTPAKPTAKPAKPTAKPAKRPATKPVTKPAAKPAAKKPATAKKPGATKTPVRKAAAKTPVPKPAPAAGKAPTRGAAKPAGKTARPRLKVVPDPPARPRKARTAAEERDGVRSRASVPGWADVLLGTTPGDH